MIIIKNGELVLENEVMKGDIAVENGKISAIAPLIEPGAADCCLDASDAYVFPGFIDPHTHFSMTNALATTADDFASGTRAAVKGGTTTIINFASPATNGSLLKGLEYNKGLAEGKCFCNYKFHMELTEFNSDVAEEIVEITKLGVTSFKVYMAYGFKLGDGLIYEAMKTVKKTGALIGAHCENGEVINALTAELKAKGAMGATSHPLSRPAALEAEAINRFAMLGKLADYPVHIVHVSSAEGLRTIRRLRKDGYAITAETCPHYLTLTDSRYALPDGESLKYIMSPPLRTDKDIKCLIEGIKNGEFQTIATDHCSYTFEQKLQGIEDFSKTPGGIPGTEERVALMYTLLRASHEGGVAPVEFAKLLSTNAAKLYQMYPRKGVLAVGSDADITVYKKEGITTLNGTKLQSKSGYTVFEGFPVEGQAEYVLVNGEIAVKQGRLTGTVSGQFVL